MAPIDDALAALNSLEPGEEINITHVATKYGCCRSSLSRRWRGVQGSLAQKYEKQQLLSVTQETEIVKYIDELRGRGLPPTRQMIRSFASTIAERPLSRNWVVRFTRRHKIELLLPWASDMDERPSSSHPENPVLSASDMDERPLTSNSESSVLSASDMDERPSSKKYANSVLRASDWRKIERLLRQAVADVYDKHSRQLSHIHALSERNILLQHEHNRLREALDNEKKKRNPRRALPLESPNRIQKARDRQQQKDATKKAIQHQKEEVKSRKGKGRTRVIAKKAQVETRVQKALRNLATTPSQLPQNNTKNKGKSKAITPQHSSGEEEPPDEPIEEDSISEMAAPAPTPAHSRRRRAINLSARSRRSRTINIPGRYRT